MKPRFQPDNDPGAGQLPPARLVDPEAYDASEQQFAATLEETPQPRFVVQDTEAGTLSSVSPPGCDDVLPGAAFIPEGPHAACSSEPPGADNQPEEASAAPEAPPACPGSDAWRQEVAARVSHYRTRRRTRTPRYPSLQLKFESTDASWETGSVPGPPVAANRLAVAVQGAVPISTPPPETDASVSNPPSVEPESSAKILEFPRLSWTTPAPVDELAEPVFDQPRILEVPEVLPPPPALGGMLIEPAEAPAAERRPGFELPLQAASLKRRILASGTDALLVLLAFSLFAYTFFRITAAVPPWQLAAGVSAGLIALFWAAYQYLLLVYAGTTPGLRFARLQLSRFDGTAVPRKLRRWRVLASMLSGLSLALGYAWCFLDEDELCWHDRITRTYMAPRKAN